MGKNISNIEESLLLPKASIREEKVEAEALSSCTAGGWESFIGEVEEVREDSSSNGGSKLYPRTLCNLFQ
ncbi:hypothetical protein OWV82_016079 [Melia azedarach]|uniref:Uncharacterized protein n=1 Tax=Melia azedarach TaxID=155640 RepID=A0ACC1XHH7_MELAZ|nr:hypothetical protein OWV82_016079 [Melia azedarach]